MHFRALHAIPHQHQIYSPKPLLPHKYTFRFLRNYPSSKETIKITRCNRWNVNKHALILYSPSNGKAPSPGRSRTSHIVSQWHYRGMISKDVPVNLTWGSGLRNPARIEGNSCRLAILDGTSIEVSLQCRVTSVRTLTEYPLDICGPAPSGGSNGPRVKWHTSGDQPDQIHTPLVFVQGTPNRASDRSPTPHRSLDWAIFSKLLAKSFKFQKEIEPAKLQRCLREDNDDTLFSCSAKITVIAL